MNCGQSFVSWTDSSLYALIWSVFIVFIVFISLLWLHVIYFRLSRSSFVFIEGSDKRTLYCLSNKQLQHYEKNKNQNYKGNWFRFEWAYCFLCYQASICVWQRCYYYVCNVLNPDAGVRQQVLQLKTTLYSGKQWTKHAPKEDQKQH